MAFLNASLDKSLVTNHNNVPADIRFEDNVGLVHIVAKALHSRLMAYKMGTTYEDAFQEASYAFVTAVRGFDESKGFKFSTYFSKTAHTHLTKVIKQECHYLHDIKAVSIEGLVKLGDPSIHEDTPYEFIEDEDGEDPEHEVMIADLVSNFYAGLSPSAKYIVDLAVTKPSWLKKELKMRMDKIRLGKELGNDVRDVLTTLDATADICMKLHPLSQSKSRSLRKELSVLAGFIR